MNLNNNDSNKSSYNSLNKEDWKQWGQETLIYCIIPAFIVFLNNLQTGGDYHLAAGAAYVAFLASLTNLLTKFSKGS